MKYMRKLLFLNINKLQFTGFAIANFIGLLIILTALQFYRDVNPLFQKNKENVQNKDFLTLTHQVGFLDALGGGSKFSQKEIEELKSKDFIKKVGPFVSAKYEVYGGIKSGKFNFGTELFFEAIPDEYIDVDLSNWKYREGAKNIPIIIPRNYLNLYNFGFADARNLPKMSESMISAIPLDISVRGNQKRGEFTGKIIGFSDRINTILVPMSFMEWSNKNFGNSQSNDYSRVMIEVTDSTNPEIMQYIDSKGYKIEGDKGIMSKASNVLMIMMSIVSMVGVIICSLAIYVFILTLYLLLEKNMDKVTKLRLMGYSKNQVCRPYISLILGINFLIIVFSLISVFIIRSIYTSYIRKTWGDAVNSSSLEIILVGFLIYVILSSFSIIIMRRKVNNTKNKPTKKEQ